MSVGQLLAKAGVAQTIASMPTTTATFVINVSSFLVNRTGYAG